MCGILFILDKRGRPVPAAALSRGLRAMAHRGPDDEASFVSGGVALGFRRLSIVDVAGGQQPLFNEDETVALICNGEIYNYRELREELLARGHSFRTHSDCETILHLYEEDPENFVARLDGMFGFVLLDLKRRRAVVARDRVGIKPLLVHDGGGYLIVASEAKAILATGLVPFGLDAQSIYDFFAFSYIPGRRTAFAGIENVPPGERLDMTLDGGAIASRPYWTPEFPPFAGNRFHAVSPFAARLRETFTAAVASHTIGDLPVAAYLSGGIDSTVTALVLQKVLGPEAKRLHTFSIGFADPEFDESPIFRQTIAAAGFQAEVLESPPVDAALFRKVLWHLEQPQSSLLDVPMFALSGLVRDKGLKVILAGEGSDELYGGYFQYTLNQIRRALTLPGVAGLHDFLLPRVLRYYFGAEEDRRVVGEILSRDARPVIERFGTYPAWYPTWQIRMRQREGLFRDEPEDSLGETSAMAAMAAPLKDRYAGIDDFNKSIYLELTTRLPNYILARSDRNSMAHSVELRVPFLANAMIADACAMPPMVKMLALKEKYVLRQAFAKVVPRHVQKRMKFGYNAPALPLWQGRDALRDELMSQDGLRRTGIFAPSTVAAWSKEAAETTDARRRSDLYGRLTSVLSVQLLHDAFAETAAEAAAAA